MTVALTFAACYSIDCPVDSLVELQVSFYDANAEKEITLDESLTITAAGTDSVLINKLTGKTGFQMPLQISAQNDGEVVDKMQLQFVDKNGQVTTDELTLKHRSFAHFEGMDCPTLVFHQLLDAQCTDNRIESVEIVRNLVNYDKATNIRLHLRPAAE